MLNFEKMSLMEIKSYLTLLDESELMIAQQTLLKDNRKGVRALAIQVEKKLTALAKDKVRIKTMWHYEQLAIDRGYGLIVGTDEVGRGPLAGPVVAGAVILPRDCHLPGVNDSKKLSSLQREVLCKMIKEQAVAYAISEVSPLEIDRINILQASRLAMAQAVAKLNPQGDFVLMDGWHNPLILTPGEGILQGDSKSISIAAASILAKVYRDQLMMDYDHIYPQYGFKEHKGYPTASHVAAVGQYGPCPIHRLTFKPVCDYQK